MPGVGEAKVKTLQTVVDPATERKQDAMVCPPHIKALLPREVGAEKRHIRFVVQVIGHGDAECEIAETEIVFEMMYGCFPVSMNGRVCGAVAFFKGWKDNLEEAEVLEGNGS